VLVILGVIACIAHVVIYRQTSVSALVDLPEFYYNRFIIRDRSGHAIREVGLSTGYWSYATAGLGVVCLVSAGALLIVARRRKP